MENSSPFKIFSASAGSGKTFNLVKEYLRLLLSTNNPVHFRQILALTFTNKAVGEMKERIVDALQQFSKAEILVDGNTLFNLLCAELNLSPIEVHQKSIKVLRNILHNYAAFDVSTIDKFNHRLIRTFANDLKLPVNFEVELDTEYILQKAVDNLINKAGTDLQLTKLLVAFALEKVDDDKSWDVSYDLNQIATILINENDRPYLIELRDKNLNDFQNLKTNLISKITTLERKVVSKSLEVLEMFSANGLETADFSRGTLPNHFIRISEGQLQGLYGNNLQENLADGSGIYTKTLDTQKKASIDALLPSIEDYYLSIKSEIHELLFLKNALNNITPLSVINAINTSLRELTTENELVLISDFNALINDEIRDQPAPYIYERIGERYRHYFIDEFQDTSVMQWRNLMPLIDNSLSQVNPDQQHGSAVVVGDAKQAIYRWRGGRAEQFINLFSLKDNPFSIPGAPQSLPKNFRSHRDIVEFNNSFFEFLSRYVFREISHQELFAKSHQEINSPENGLVELSFLELSDVNIEEKADEYSKATIQKILDAIDRGFKYSDICIITRKKKESIAIANYLSIEGIPIISSESLLLKNSPEVRYIISMLTLFNDPKNYSARIEVLSYLADSKLADQNKHAFFEHLIFCPINDMFREFEELGFEVDLSETLSLPLYEMAESLIRSFKFNERSDAYIQFLLDEIYKVAQKDVVDLSAFLEYWEQKMDKLSVVSPSGSNAVELMTIHKSKGLEFPIVIFPFANEDIYRDINPKMWVNVDPTQFSGFRHLYVGINKDLEHYKNSSEKYLEYKSQQELDSLNLLYVVLTRAISELYIISELDLNSKGESKPHLFSGMFINYLKEINRWDNAQQIYRFGEPIRNSNVIDNALDETYLPLISTSRNSINLNILSTSGLLWDTEQESAIDRGELLHYILSKIEYAADVPLVLKDLLDRGDINPDQHSILKEQINQLVHHPALQKFYSPIYVVLNEREIISSHGRSFRPDRLMIDGKEAAIIDYKTGAASSFHIEQIETYAKLVEDMDFRITHKILLYLNDNIQIKEL